MSEKDFFFEEDGSSQGGVPMGTVLDEQVLVENSVVEEVDENEFKKFKDFCGDRPYLAFEKKDIAHFIDLVGYHSRLNYDVYTLSFKIDSSDVGTGRVSLVYNNGNVLAISDVKVKNSGSFTSHIVSVDTLLRVFSASRGYLFIFEEDSNLYAYVLGGKVYLETFKVETDICSKEFLVDQISAVPSTVEKVGPKFVETLKQLYDIVRTGSRADEKAIYFKGNKTYIYSGVVLGEFPGFGLDLTVQDFDISTLIRYFFDTTGQVSIENHGIFMKFSSESRCVYLARRSMELSDDMKYSGYDSKDSAVVDVNSITSVVSFLIGLPNNTGILNITPCKDGVSLTCFQKALDNNSSFKARGIVTGDGISEVHLQLDTLKTFLKVFRGQVTLKTKDNRLYVSGPEGEIVIFGNL